MFYNTATVKVMHAYLCLCGRHQMLRFLFVMAATIITWFCIIIMISASGTKHIYIYYNYIILAF